MRPRRSNERELPRPRWPAFLVRTGGRLANGRRFRPDPSTRRLSYTALGGNVNLAQRLEANAPVGGILIAERTHEQLAGALPTRRREPIQVKGIDEPVLVYEVVLESEGEPR